MKYDYPNLGDTQFEELVIVLCKQLFGTATQGFAKGPDGGRDAKFVGTAERFPSIAGPWKGKIIIQAKHTNGYNKSFSENDFFSEGNKSCVLQIEIPRIRNLRKQGDIDYYFLVANRRLSGNANTDICRFIAKEADIPESQIYLAGLEQLEMWLKEFPQIVRLSNIDLVDSPLQVSPEELAEVIEALVRHKGTVEKPPVKRTSLEEKDKLNQMTEEYSKKLRKLYLSQTKTIDTFLADPINEELREKYDVAANEIDLKIISKRKDYQNFDEVMEHLADLLFAQDVVLSKNKRLTRATLYYMYWSCDIGRTTEEEDEHVETI